MSLIDKIKMLFEATEVTESKFLDAKLVDGTIVRVEGDAFKVGDAVQVITEAGETVQAPEGEHELEDGTVLVIDAEGKITEVRAIEPVAEEAPEEEMAEEVEAPEAEVAGDNLAERVAALEEALAMLIEKLAGNQAEMTATKEALSKVTAEKELLEKAPAAKAIVTKKFEKTEVAKSTSTNRIADLLANNTKK